MLKAPIPVDEEARLAALRALQILDTAPEERFDRVTRIASALFEARIALVSLVDHQRQWFKSRHGLEAGQTPRDISFCGHAIHGGEIFVVPDTHNDPRFIDNPLVTGAPEIRFYAGAPLTVGSGHRVGTLCIIDDRPRSISREALQLLRDLADVVERELRHQQIDDATRILRDHEQRLRTVVDSLQEAVVLTSDSGTVISANPAADRCFGLGAGELTGTMLSGRLAPAEQQRFSAMLQRSLVAPEPVSFETWGTRPGNQFPMHVCLGSVSLLGVRQIVCVMRDLTDRRRLDRLKSDLIASVSHELRTPLTSIQGALALITGGAAGEVSDKALELAGIAHRNSQRLVRLVNDILDTEKIESGRLVMRREDQRLFPLLQQVLESNRDYAKQQGVDLKLEGDTAVSSSVDTDRFVQIITNLLSNAIKFSPRPGVVLVSLAGDGAHCRVTVDDEGPGVPEEFRDQLFEKFSQADNGSARSHPGTGLGLSLARSLTERLGGTIGYEPRAGGGSRFYIGLPVS